MSLLARKNLREKIRVGLLAGVVGVAGFGIGMSAYGVATTDSKVAVSTSSVPAASSTATANADTNLAQDPWARIQQLHDQMDRLFAKDFAAASGNNLAFAVPNIDLRDAGDHYQVVIDMPGTNQNSIKVNVQGRMLSVSGQRAASSETNKNGKLLRSERSAAQWARVMTLPGPVNAAAVQSHYANGVLTVTIPKAAGKVAVTAPARASKGENQATDLAGSPAAWAATPFSASDPWDQLDQFHNSMDQLFSQEFDLSGANGAREFTVPSMDVTNQKDRYEVRMDMPGADKSKLKVNVDGQQLTVSGERQMTDESANGGKVIRSERATAEFERSMTLPGPVRATAVQAKYENGVLTIDLPKSEAGASSTSVSVK
jgi:HSP20 family protein